MDTSELRRVCPLLRGPENYAVWKSKMEMVLIREKLWSIVCERRTKPESGAKAQTDFDDDAEKATATIFLYLSETAERYVRDIRDPVEVWAKLKEVFSKVGFAARYNLWKRLFSIEVGYSQNVVEYLDKVRSVAIALRESGAVVSDEILVTAALQGLNKEFDTLVSVITHGEQPTFDSLTALLEEEYVRKGMRPGGNVVPGENHVAFGAVAGKGCWNCGKPGHKRHECTELRQAGQASTGPLPTPGGGRGLSPGREKVMGVQEATEASW